MQKIEYLTIDQNMIMNICDNEVWAIESIIFLILGELILSVLTKRINIGKKIRAAMPMQQMKTNDWYSLSNNFG